MGATTDRTFAAMMATARPNGTVVAVLILAALSSSMTMSVSAFGTMTIRPPGRASARLCRPPRPHPSAVVVLRSSTDGGYGASYSDGYVPDDDQGGVDSYGGMEGVGDEATVDVGSIPPAATGGINAAPMSPLPMDDVVLQEADNSASPCVIKVLGVGGGGGNAVNRMIETRVSGVAFWALNTDAQALSKSLAPNVLNIGRQLTRGLGAGGDPEVGKGAAMENGNDIEHICEGADMVFITAGMG
eukprot:CAMPEP_0183305636 /NCGR_PEP_ID=MMETSP0160_2-20130417/10314_1 /TAXON_ID=2839 ORGANISM="Odontella Sinensis, Strain Grunow 1884" /NCGR_SAMPLE_ID=MMETSP0160_2 /ASSEMBLY_ACC=CAM_ASM_000250 /LENGTH=243 /DNA_ID=CAMNT_0025468869 /DNA_START=203 /DNA_END=931 /DNA_ORIENTATION=+